MTKAEQMVDAIAGGIGDAPKLHDLDDGETVRLKIGYMKTNRRDTEGITISFHFGQGTAETVNAVADVVEPRLDRRKFQVSEDQPLYKQTETWDIGWVDVDNEGEIVDYEIDADYLKPSEA